MHDWNKFVRSHMANLDLPNYAKDEVVTELAAHLEDSDADPLADQGSIPSTQAWRKLSRAIQRAKCEEDAMNHRTKSLCIPTLATFFAASISLTVCQFLGMHPRIVLIGEIAMPLYLPWLATLPICGALGARLSQRTHGRVPTRLAAGLSPALIMLIVMLLVLPVGLAIDGAHFLQLVSFGLLVIDWVVIPATALLIGALPFALKSEVRQALTA